MAECNFHETPNMLPNLDATPSNKQQFRLNEINEIKDYFIAEIKDLVNISLLLTILISHCKCYWNNCRNDEGKL